MGNEKIIPVLKRSKHQDSATGFESVPQILGRTDKYGLVDPYFKSMIGKGVDRYAW